jgi:hypothetical protein
MVENIISEPEEICCIDVDWIHLPQDRVYWWTLNNMILNIQVP